MKKFREFRHTVFAGALTASLLASAPLTALAAEAPAGTVLASVAEASVGAAAAAAEIPAGQTAMAGAALASGMSAAGTAAETLAEQAAGTTSAAAAPVLLTPQKLTLSEKGAELPLGGSGTLTVDYTGLTGGFADLGVVSSDLSVVQTSLRDDGNGKATLTLTGAGFGSASVAVYAVSNPAIVAYAAVRSGFAQDGKSYTLVQGQTVSTVYDDRIVSYNAVLSGANGATLAVQSVSLERESGLDRLRVQGELLTQDSKLPGLSAFYANLYDAAGTLIKRQAVYVEKPLNYSQVTLDWYLPDGCAKVVME